MSIGPDDLIPVPQELERAGGAFEAAGRLWRADARSLEHVAVAWKLTEELSASVEPAGLPPHTVTVGEPEAAGLEAPDREQGYVLRVGPDGVVVRGRDVDGLYWGLVTLEQLLGGGMALSCCTVRDWPAFALRGHHDDISRKQVSKLDDFLRIIRRLSRYKINVYTPYMEDVLYLKSYPDVGTGRGRLEPEEVAAMHREAERYNVMIMPTYSLVGHQENLLADPNYAHLGRRVFQPMSSLDVTKPEVREFLGNVIRDVCELFPAPYFHACFDETQGLGAEEFLNHANWCAAELRKYGKRMPMWVDMIFNHFGYDMIGRLDQDIIPVNWQYGCLEGDVPHQRELCAQGRPVWGLAGYSSTCAFVPEFRRGKDCIDAWVRVGLETDTPALFSSQWGDHGYENHRDMAWNLFAYLGEGAWSGTRARRDDFERRFQSSFYGTELPELTELIEGFYDGLSMSARECWQFFRCNAFWTVRWAAANPDAGQLLEADEERIALALATVARCRQTAPREKDHLDHFRVGLLRTRSVVRRLQFGRRYAAGMSTDDAAACVAAIKEDLNTVRDAYAADWRRTNKEENIEVSLAVYDEVEDSYDDLLAESAGGAGRPGKYCTLDLAPVLNKDFLAVGGLPLGLWECNGVPFLFAGRDRTHVAFDRDSGRVALAFADQEVRDVHLIVAAHKVGEEPLPALRVELTRGGKVVYAEDLLNIEHLCDWWAPLGEHIWAGGGMAHVDPARVRYALKPGQMYGLAETFNFGIPAGTRADGLRLAPLGEGEIRLFAVTLETA